MFSMTDISRCQSDVGVVNTCTFVNASKILTYSTVIEMFISFIYCSYIVKITCKPLGYFTNDVWRSIKLHVTTDFAVFFPYYSTCHGNARRSSQAQNARWCTEMFACKTQARHSRDPRRICSAFMLEVEMRQLKFARKLINIHLFRLQVAITSHFVLILDFHKSDKQAQILIQDKENAV